MTDTLKELWAAFKGQLSDRLANPFSGAFVIAWSVLNFRLIVVFFWAEPYAEKFKYIDETLYPHLGHWLLRGFLVPVVLAYGYLLLYPRATMWSAAQYRKLQSRANNEMREAQGEALMTHEEYREKRRQLTEIQARLTAEAARIADEAASQTDLINSQRETIAELQAKLSAMEPTGESQPSGKVPEEEPAEPPVAPSHAHSDDAKLLLDSLADHPPGPDKNLVLPVGGALDAEVGNPSPLVNYPEVHGRSPTPVQRDPLGELLNSSTKVALLKALTDSSVGHDTDELAAHVVRTVTTVVHHLEVMEDLGLVSYSRESEDVGHWYLTKEGRAFVVEKELVQP